MSKIFATFKVSFVCLLALAIGVLNSSVVANATEVEGTIAAVVVVESYAVEGGHLEAGKDVTINLVLHNTSRTTAATSILMTVSSSTGLIYPAYGNDNQFFVGTITAGASETVSIPITVSQNYNAEAVDLTCKFDYASLNNTMTNSATIVIPTSGGSSIEVNSLSVSSHATVNGESLLSINYVNRTNEKISDAEIIVTGNVSLDSRVIKLDPVKAGKSYSEDCRIKFTSAGDQEIEVAFAYTDIDGERVETSLGKYSVEVEENQAVVVENENEQLLKWGGLGLTALGLLLAMIAILVYIKKKVF